MKSEVINIKTPVSRVGNKTAILHILYALFPLHYGRFIDVFGGSGSVLLGKPTIDAFEVYNDFDRNLVNLFRCMKERTMATIRELGFCHLNSREDFIAIRKFFDHETFDDKFLTEELMLTEIMLPPLEAAELKETRLRITEDHDVRRAAMFLKLFRNSYSSSGKSFASQPFDIRKLFGLIQELEDRMANVVIENQDFETLIRHYDRPDAFFYADPPYFSTEDMYEVGFGWDDHVRLRETLGRMKGKFLLSYNDCPEIRELYDGFSLFDFSRTHSMAQRYPNIKNLIVSDSSPRSLLKQKVNANFAEYKEQWLKMSPAELIDRCEELEAVTRMAQELPSAVSDEDAEYLLQFKNPLEVVSDEWISRNGIDSLIVDDEMSHLLWSLQDRGDAEQCYELEPEFSDDEEAPSLSM